MRSQLESSFSPDAGTVPQIVLRRGRATWTCAACGTRHRVRPDTRCGGVLFCDECRDWSRNLTAWDDLGAGD